MKKLFMFSIVIAVLSLFMTAHAGDKNVNVVNQPTVSSAQSGSWEVIVNNTTSNPIPIDGAVEIVNPDPIPVLTDYFPREPFLKTATLSVPSGSYGDGAVIFLGTDIPAGNILVLESFSWRARMPLTDFVTDMEIDILPEVGLTKYIYPFIPPFRPDGIQFNISQNYQLMRLYLDSGTALRVHAISSGNGGFGMSVIVTGYLIPDDSPSLAP